MIDVFKYIPLVRGKLEKEQKKKKNKHTKGFFFSDTIQYNTNKKPSFNPLFAT